MQRLSVIVPTLNEASNLVVCLEPLQAWRTFGHEIIVVDGGSSDNTSDVAKSFADIVVDGNRGRASQMNVGIERASGDAMLFLHADTKIPLTAPSQIAEASVGETEFWGRFDVTLDANDPIFRIIETFMNWRSRFTGIATGDQAIFVSRSLLRKVGGIPNLALMEDIALSRALRREVWPLRISNRVVTSARRWQQHGVLKTIAIMWFMRAAFYFGADPAWLRSLYERNATQHNRSVNERQ